MNQYKPNHSETAAIKRNANLLGADHCEIEPEYEELSHWEAASYHARGCEIDKEGGKPGQLEWMKVTDNHVTEVFKKGRFRRQKSCPDQKL